MLRISEISNSNKEVILKLEGKIIDSWIEVLENECAKYINHTDSELVLDLAEVSYISSDGIILLYRIKNRIKIVNAQPYIELCLKNRGLKNQIN